ncbi:hypothetical protein BJ085DRAFT_5939, partial [Dimargaris cristalligena]
IQIGLDGLIGLVPAAGDCVNVAIALYLVKIASSTGLPGKYKAKMIRNIAIDGGIGTIPVLGDIFDIIYKANLRNLAIFEKWIGK